MLKKKIVIVGAGPAGIGFGILLKKLGIHDFAILEKDRVGATFYKWPKEMKLITPSFTGHGFGLLDLNAITPDTSPAYTFKKEHLSGEEYGDYLDMLAEHFELPVYEETDVKKAENISGIFTISTSQGTVEASSVVWATGEYHFPNKQSIEGAEHAIHNSEVSSWKELSGEQFTIIGGYESGIDAATHLIDNGKRVTLFSKTMWWNSEDADPSRSLSPFTLERFEQAKKTKRLHLSGNCEVIKIVKEIDGYTLFLSNGTTHKTETKPILATGFHSGAKQIEQYFDWREDGLPALNAYDESVKQPNLFLIGPHVRQKEVIFCFIYKFRQRFAVVAKEILDRLEMDYDEAVLEKYRQNNMYLDDLSCCEVKCEC